MATATLNYIRVSQAGDLFKACFNFGVTTGVKKRWTLGSFTLSDGKTATVLRAHTFVDEIDGKTYVVCEGTLSAPLRYREVVTASAAQDAVFVRSSDGNAAFSGAAVTNHAVFKADGNFGPAADGPAVTPIGVPDAIDPTSLASLYDWAAPDLETGYSNGDPIQTMTGRKSGLTTRYATGSVGEPQSFVTDAFGSGKHGTAIRNTGGNTSFQSWRHGVTTASGDSRTLIAVYKNLATQTWASSFAFNTTLPSKFREMSRLPDPGIVVYVHRKNASQRDAWVNFAKSPTTGAATSGTIEDNANSNNVANVGNTIGRMYDFAAYLTDDEVRGVVRWLLEFYGAHHAPRLYISSTGNDSTGDGTTSAPFATIAGAYSKTVAGLGTHLVLRDNLSDTGNYVYPGLGNYDRCWIYPEAAAANPHAVARIRRAASSFAPVRINAATLQSGFTDNQFSGVWGLEVRDGTKIPTDSPLRIGGDASFSSGATTQTRILEIVSSGSMKTDVLLGNCHGVGFGIATCQDATSGGPDAVTVDIYRCSAAHAWGSGHTNPIFLTQVNTCFVDDVVLPSAGWEPINSVEADDIFSHATYLNYQASGSYVYRHFFNTRASSHGSQFRVGGVLLDSVYSQNAIGFNSVRGTLKIDRLWLEGGKAINGHGDPPRGMMMELGPADYVEVTNSVLAGTTYTSGNAYGVKINSDFYNPTGTATWWDRDLTDTIYAFQNCTFLKCPNFLFGTSAAEVVVDPEEYEDLGLIRGLALKKNIFVQDGTKKVYQFGMADADLTGMPAHDNSENLYQPGSGDFASTSSGTKTRAQMATILGETDSIETTVTFTDDTRRVAGYLSEISVGALAADGATDEDTVAYAMIADRLAGQNTTGYRVSDLLDWLMEGVTPDSETPVPASGGYYGAVAYQEASNPAGSRLGLQLGMGL